MNAGKYVVNVDIPTHQIHIHHTTCPYYLEWAGVKDPANGGWSVEYELLEEAQARAYYEAGQLTWASISGPPCHRCPPHA